MNIKQSALLLCWLLVPFTKVTAQAAPTTPSQTIQHNWMALIFEQKNPRGFTSGFPRYFLRYPDGTVHSFAPGEQPEPAPMPVPKVARAIGIWAGNSAGFALLEDGTLMGWGSNTVSPSHPTRLL